MTKPQTPNRPDPRRNRSDDLSDGILSAALTPLRGESLGWTLAFMLFGPWMVLVTRVFLPVPIVGLAITLASLGALYSAAHAYFGACMTGVRAGLLEPAEFEFREDPSFGRMVLPGLAVLAWIVVAVLVVAVPLYAAGIQSQWVPTVGAFAVTAWLPAGLALMAAWRSPLALLHVRAQLMLVRRAGWHYVVPATVAWVAMVGPWQLFEFGVALGWIPAAGLQAIGALVTGTNFAAMGAAMGWLARQRSGVAEVLDAA